ncbi:MAG: HK97 gp10 family phage protein [Lachnospirales bacterium]
MKCNVDIKELKELQQRLEKRAKKQEVDALCEQIANGLAARLWRKVVKLTPVGENRYIDLLVWSKKKDGSARVVRNKDGTPKLKQTTVYRGGTLKKSWRVGTAVKKLNMVSVEVANNIFYASYVEYGHRTRKRKDGSRGFVDGKLMMTISVQELKQSKDKIAEKYLKAYLRRMLND